MAAPAGRVYPRFCWGPGLPERYPDPDVVILSGSPSYQAAVVPAGLIISGISRIRGDRYRSAPKDQETRFEDWHVL